MSVFDYGPSHVRTLTDDDQPWFVGKDICEALELKDHNKSLSRLDIDERRGCLIVTPSGKQNMVVVNESGVFHLIFRSNKPEAKAFRKWVTSEVLPELRKKGTFSVKLEPIAGVNPITYDGRTGYPYIKLLKALGYSTISGYVNIRRRKNPDHFWLLLGTSIVSPAYARLLQKQSELRQMTIEFNNFPNLQIS